MAKISVLLLNIALSKIFFFYKNDRLFSLFSETCGKMVQNFVANKIFGPTYASNMGRGSILH